MFDPDFTYGNTTKTNDINLSTSQSTSSSALLNTVRAERIAREEKRVKELAAVKIQRVWRGRKVAGETKKALIDRLNRQEQDGMHGAGLEVGLEQLGRGLIVLLRDGWVDNSQRKDVEKLLDRWCRLSIGPSTSSRDGDIIPSFVRPLSNDRDWAIILGLLASKSVELLSMDPTSSSLQPTTLLASLECIFDPKSYSSLPPDTAQYAKETIVDIVQDRQWVERLVIALEKLAAVSLPKKKNPSLTPVTRLLTAPFSLVPPESNPPLIPPLINHLLAVPSLPALLPLPALTHLSTHISLFTLLLPYAASNPSVLSSGRLGDELGKTYLLANLSTFGITGGMLARHGVSGASVWMEVIGNLLGRLDEGWGRWVDGYIDIEEDVAPRVEESDSEDEDLQPQVQSLVPTRARPQSKFSRHRRELLPQAMRNKLVVFATPLHINALSVHILSPTSMLNLTSASRASSSSKPNGITSANTLEAFATFCVGLLTAFRGTPKWEAVLDALSDGEKGRGLVKRIWREGVRGKWSGTEDRSAWDTFNQNRNTPCLLLLTYIYNHYLLLTPDDEFFTPSTNALSTDEVLELVAIWRDLAFWGYMNGVSSTSTDTRDAVVNSAARDTNGSGSGTMSGKWMGNEEVRGSFTRGVTRVVERNGRRKFADPDFWVMRSHSDLRGFVEAAVFEDAELTSTDDADIEMTDSSSLPRWARARQRFTKRQMAFLSPRLGLLNNLPMSVPFQTRLEVFRKFIDTDQYRLRIDRHGRRRGTRIRVNREKLAEDGFDELSELGPLLKGRVEIIFVDKHGLEEAGIDGGGLFKEFLTSLSKEVFDTNRGLWLATDQNELYPNPHSYAREPHQLNWYRFIGQILGKAIYEGMLVDVSFADFFLAKWLGRQSYLDDLASLDKELYKGLIILKNYAKPEELALNFAITEDDFGSNNTVELIPGGAEIAVTAENRHEYIQLVCKYKLDKQIAAQSKAFFNGLSDLIDAKWLRMFDQQELSQLIGGEETIIDIDDLRAHCNVDGFPNNITPTLFWKVVRSFSQEEKRALLRFVTSCSRPPLLGFAYLYPKFCIKYNNNDTTRLPSASACFNLLKLPGYMTEDALRTKLLQAITSGAGFDMS